MLVIAEQPCSIWELKPTFSLPIDRSSTTVAEYLEACGILWQFGGRRADVLLYKGGVGPVSFHRTVQEVHKRYLTSCPTVTLLGEPRELAPAEYFLARPKSTLAVAPGSSLKRLYFANTWLDPQLEDWVKRLDRVCWIGRPTAERIKIALALNEQGVPLDIYSRSKWPLPNWKGYAESEVDTSRRYKYRIVCENSSRCGYHSEKLFGSVRCGCVTFYQGDSGLDLSHFKGAYYPLEVNKFTSYFDVSTELLTRIEKFMFTDAWEIYSFKKFYDRIRDLIQKVSG